MATLAAVTLPLAATNAFATTGVLPTPAPIGLAAAGPVNSDNGFPAWYEDKAGVRVEPCLDGLNPLCGFVGAPVDGFDSTQPAVFPTNFPDEQFYMLAGSQLTLPNGGKATLTLGLEAAFANAVQNGDQMVFARQRVVVVGGPASTTLHFHHPYGDLDIDTDGTGKGKLVQDVAPSVGNFDTALKGIIGPFLTWDSSLPATPAGYLGDPAVAHAINPGPNGSVFSVNWSGAPAISTPLFNLQGKIATNAGVRADAAIQGTDSAGNPVIDVFASSAADPNELYVAASDTTSTAAVKTTPMAASSTVVGAKSFYARVPVTGTVPTTITVRNVGDDPVSTSEVPVTKPSGITITAATFNGSTLHVAATSSTPGAVLTVTGYGAAGAIGAGGTVDIPTAAPAAQVTVADAGGGSATAPVQVTGGAVTPPGEVPIAASPTTGPVCTTTDPATGLDVTGPCPAGGVPAGATPTAVIAGAATTAAVARNLPITLDGSGSTNATGWQWTQVGGTPVTITGATTAKPTVTPQPVFGNPAPAQAPAAATNAAAVIQLVASNGTGSTAVKSAPVRVTVPINPDTVAVSRATYKAGSEFRVDGTSTVPNGSLVMTPPTTVAVYNAATGALLGTAQVDTTGAWSLRLRNPAPVYTAATQPRNVVAISDRGGRGTRAVT
jgi:hypothetical protein